MDCWGCNVVGVVCSVVGIVVGFCRVWLGGCRSGGGWMGVGIWAGVCFGGGDEGCGGRGGGVRMREVVCGGGGCVVVFYLHSLIPSISPAPLMLSNFLV